MNVINILKNSPDKSPTPKIGVFSEKKGNFAIFINFDARSFEIASQVQSDLLIANLCKKNPHYFSTPFDPLNISFLVNSLKT